MTTLITRPAAVHKRAEFSDHAVFLECTTTADAGCTHGFWVDLEFIQTSDDWENVTKFLFATSPHAQADTWEISDHQIPQFVVLSGVCGMISFVQISSSIASTERDIYWSYCNTTNNIASASEFEAAFQGIYSDEADFCYKQAEKSGSTDGRYSDYIDWERVWRSEFNCNGYWAEYVPGGVAVFAGVGK